MPAEFQKDIDLTLMNYENAFAYIDNILIVTKVSKDTQKQLNKLNDKNLAVS